MKITIVSVLVLGALATIYWVSTAHPPASQTDSAAISLTSSYGSIQNSWEVARNGLSGGALSTSTADVERNNRIEKGIVYCNNEPLQPVPDLATFQALSTLKLIWRDKDNVWSECRHLENANPKMFVLLNAASWPSLQREQYETDGKTVWAGSEEFPGADPATLSFIAEDYAAAAVLTNAYYLKDKSHVFYDYSGMDSHTVRLVPQADPATFTLILGDPEAYGGQTGYAKDKAHVYSNGQIVPNADPNTFKP